MTGPWTITAPRNSQGLRRSEIRHDIQHELGTILLLASVLRTSEDVGPASRATAEQILGEARWLDRLVHAYEDTDSERGDRVFAASPERIRIDTMTDTIVNGARLATSTDVTLRTEDAWACVDMLGLWRALRNVVDNAVRAAGPCGRVHVQVMDGAGWSVVQIDDDGPGFGAGPGGLASLGLGIVQDFIADHGGNLEIVPSELGGCCVRLILRAAPRVAFDRSWRTDGDQPAAV